MFAVTFSQLSWSSHGALIQAALPPKIITAKPTLLFFFVVVVFFFFPMLEAMLEVKFVLGEKRELADLCTLRGCVYA